MTPPEVKIRPVIEEDALAIGEIAERSGLFPAHLLPEIVRPYLEGSDDAVWICATDGRAVIGFAFAELEALTDGTWNLRAIGVHPNHRRRRVASTLLESLEQALRHRDIRLLVIDTSDSEDQLGARRLYKLTGYREEARVGDFWAVDVAKVTFSKRLSV